MTDVQGKENEGDPNSDCSFDEDFDEEVDPRVQGELESLNSASEEINKLETELEKARNKFRGRLADSTLKLNILHKKLGRCVQKCRPYYEQLKKSRQAQAEAQKAALQFQRSNSIYEAAKETVGLAEAKIMAKRQGDSSEKREFDSAWQEMLNHATIKFMESEGEKKASEEEHMKKAAEYAQAQIKIRVLEKDLPHSIARSRPYFDLKEKLEYVLQQERFNVDDLQMALNKTKARYKASLSQLEAISEEIHMQRQLKLKLPPRMPGVGAERNDDNSDLPSINLDMRSETSSFVSFDDDVDSMDNYPVDMRRHQRSASQDWTGGAPFSLPQTSHRQQQHTLPETERSSALRRAFRSTPHMDSEQLQKQKDSQGSSLGGAAGARMRKNSSESDVKAMENQAVGGCEASSTSASGRVDPVVEANQATVTCHEIQVDTEVEHMQNVGLESRVGTGLSAEMSKLAVKKEEARQSTRGEAKVASSKGQRSRTSRSKSRSRTPSQAFPILVGLSESTRQQSPKLPRAKPDTSASGYHSSWQNTGQGMNNSVENYNSWQNRQHEVLRGHGVKENQQKAS